MKQDWTLPGDATFVLLTKQSGFILLPDLGYLGIERHL
jgi:hypothetical protein